MNRNSLYYDNTLGRIHNSIFEFFFPHDTVFCGRGTIAPAASSPLPHKLRAWFTYVFVSMFPCNVPRPLLPSILPRIIDFAPLTMYPRCNLNSLLPQCLKFLILPLFVRYYLRYTVYPRHSSTASSTAFKTFERGVRVSTPYNKIQRTWTCEL